MTLTVDALRDFLEQTFAISTEQNEHNDIVLHLQYREYHTSLTIELFRYRTVDDNEPYYGIKLWGSFLDTDGNPLNFRHYSDAAIDELCRRLSDEITWCRLRPQAVAPEGMTVELYRSAHIPRNAPEELDGILQETINDLLCEWLMLFPVLQAVANDTLDDFSHLGMMLNLSGGTQ
jgi:hypothetical protein